MKRKPRQPLLKPLDVEELDHVQKIQNGLESINAEKWHDKKKFDVIAIRKADQSIDFVPIRTEFEDNQIRQDLRDMIDEEDIEEPWDEDLENDDMDFIGMRDEQHDHDVTAVGVINFNHVHDNPNSKKVLLFTTTKMDITEYMDNQLYTTKQAKGCPSGMEAFVTQRLTIDWSRTRVIAVAAGRLTALRLKWTTVRLCQNDSVLMFVIKHSCRYWVAERITLIIWLETVYASMKTNYWK